MKGRVNNTSERTVAALAQSKYRTLEEAARDLRVTTRCLAHRIRNGWPAERVFARSKNDRTFAWLESFTGFNPKWAKKILARAGLSWRWSTEIEIKAAINKHMQAQRSDAAHAPASTVASDQPPLMVSGDRAASACVASVRGANDLTEVAA